MAGALAGEALPVAAPEGLLKIAMHFLEPGVQDFIQFCRKLLKCMAWIPPFSPFEEQD